MSARVRTTPRKEAIQDRSKQTVDAILRATARILVKDGWDHTSTNHIAETAGVSIGSLYQYFPNKEAIVAALLERHITDMSRLLTDAASHAVTWPLERAVRHIIEAMIDAHRVDPQLHKVFVEQLPRFGRLDRIHQIEEQGLALVRTYLELRRAELGVEDLDMAAFVVVHAVESLTHAAVVLHPEMLESDRLIEETTAMVVRYLRA
jgi:AcrR family transcriptional regulator